MGRGAGGPKCLQSHAGLIYHVFQHRRRRQGKLCSIFGATRSTRASIALSPSRHDSAASCVAKSVLTLRQSIGNVSDDTEIHRPTDLSRFAFTLKADQRPPGESSAQYNVSHGLP
jgi:hypothetical protein